MARLSKRAITEKKELIIDYHLQGYSIAEMALQFKLTETQVVNFLNDAVTQAESTEIVEKKKARQVEILRIHSMMKLVSAQFDNAEDERTDSGTLTRDSVKATGYLVDRMIKLIELKAKLLGLYSIEDVIGKQNQNRLLALDYENVSDQELAFMYASALNSTQTE